MTPLFLALLSLSITFECEVQSMFIHKFGKRIMKNVKATGLCLCVCLFSGLLGASLGA